VTDVLGQIRLVIIIYINSWNASFLQVGEYIFVT
jgi:hypothetical protein